MDSALEPDRYDKAILAELQADGAIAIAYKPSEGRMRDILDRLAIAGVAVKDLSTDEADLEDVFMGLTYDADAAAAP